MQNVSLFRLSLPLLVGVSLIAAAPVQSQDAATATVTCTDGSSSKAGQGACSHHGGVNKGAAASTATAGATAPSTTAPAAGAKPAPTAAVPTATPAATAAAAGSNAVKPAATTDTKSGTPTAKCNDGTMSYSKHHSGSCSSHGGVAQFLDK
jgi:hypothetical protein